MDFKNLDFTPSDPSTVVERILINVHTAIDSTLPDADQAPKRYSKTVFNDEDKTGLVKAAIEYDKKLQEQEALQGDTKENNVEEDLKKAQNLEKQENEIPDPSNSDNLTTQAGIEFSQMYSAIDNKAVKSKKELWIVIIGLILLLCAAGAYYYFIEMNQQ